MELRTYRNKAFLSYRHVEKDEKLAALLQRKLENYRISGKIRGTMKAGSWGNAAEQVFSSGAGSVKGSASPAGAGLSGSARPAGGVGRIFRDTTDLGARADLTKELRRELDDSEYLIVLCSEAAVGSKWIEREIRYFLQTHETDKILPVLADGEPEEILPAMFGGIEGMPRHPVACDFRGSRRRALREELPRLAAALLDCPYGELMDRRRRYEAGRLAAIAAAAVLFLSGLAGYYALTSARIRKSLKERQIGESESLAVRSETALSQRLRLDAIRYALEALPEKEDDRPVSEKAMLALQKATAAYVPEGNRMLAQTGEFAVSGWINSFSVGEIQGTTCLAASCEENGTEYSVLWNADTGEKIFDSSEPEDLDPAGTLDGAEGQDARPGKDAGQEGCFNRITDQGFFIAKDAVFHQEIREWISNSRTEKDGNTTRILRRIDPLTGRVLWQLEERDLNFWKILDVQDGMMILEAHRSLPDDPSLPKDAAAVSGVNEVYGRENVPENSQAPERAVYDLQLRSTEDGSLLCRRRYERKPDRKHYRFVASALAGRKGEPAVFIEQTEKTDDSKLPAGEKADGTAELPETDLQFRQRMYALDPETGEERLLIEERENRFFQALAWTSESKLLAVLYEGPVFQGTVRQTLLEGDTRFCYSESGKEHFTICCVDPRSGAKIWEKTSDCTQNTNVRLLQDLEINGRQSCLLSTGTHVDIFARDTGESLYSLDFPAPPACLRTGQYLDQEALEAVLQDGSKAWYCFSGGEILRKDAVFPGSILSAQEAGGRYFFLCSKDRDVDSNNRIYVFGEDVFDTEVSNVIDTGGMRILDEMSFYRFSMEQGEQYVQTPAGGLFVLKRRDEETARGIDARTGKICWKTSLGKCTKYAGMTEDGSRMVFRDYIVDGRTAAKKRIAGEPVPDPVWKILYPEDGRIETIGSLEKNGSGDSKGELFKYTVGGDSLVLLLRLEKQGKSAESQTVEHKLLRYGISDGKTEMIDLTADESRNQEELMISTNLVHSPDGLSTLCTFTTDLGEPLNYLVSWKTHEVTRLKDSPLMEEESFIAFSRDNSRILYFSAGSQALLYSGDGTLLRSCSDESGTLQGACFWKNSLFLVEVSKNELHFRIPEKGTDILLPAGEKIQYDLAIMPQLREIPVWELPGRKLLLQYGSEAFVFDPENGAVEAVIDNVLTYNPKTDTLLLMDSANTLAVSPRYGWRDLMEKGRRILEKSRTSRNR